VNRHHLRQVAAVLATAATMVALAACGTSSHSSSATARTSTGFLVGPGVDAATKTITIGNIGAITGPAGPLGIPALAGAKVAVDEINATGGIDGWKLKILFRDAAYVPQQQVQAYDAINGQIAVLQSFGSPTTLAIQPQFDAAKLLTFPLSWDSAWDKDPLLAPVGTPYALDIANGLHYLITVKHLGTKIGIVYQNDEYGADGLRGLEAASKIDGIKVVAKATYAVGDTDMTAQAEAMKSAGAQIVVVTALPSTAGPLVGTAASLGYTPTYLFQGPSFVEQLVTATGAFGATATPIAGALSKDTYVMSFVTPWGNNVPGMREMLRWQKRFAPTQIPSIYFAWAYAQTKVLADVLRKAIESKNLSRAGIDAARLNVGTVYTGGLTPPVAYRPTLGPPSTGSIINRVDSKVQGFLDPVATNIKSPVDSTLG
jgi:ABC-type branched-subunit amino acid transport system substrate-binding protein